MPANLTIYLLEKVTDYFDFERLCHDLMALEGYPKIEPLGGSVDKGRDALHIDKSGETTIFAYSVREDWRAKLAEDATKVGKHKHKCDKLVFLSTADFTAGQRDEAVANVRKDFGLTLDLYGVERLRVLLDAKHPQIKLKHPAIFPPEFLQLDDKLKADAHKKHLFLSFAPEDRVFADWLTRKLTAEGYLVWCESYKILGGERYPKDVNKAIRDETFRMVAVYSKASLSNLEVMRQRALAFNYADDRKTDFVIPIKLDEFDESQLDRETAALTFVSFAKNWATGLRQLFEKLTDVRCPAPRADGRRAATEVFFEKDVLTNEPEQLYTNCYALKSIPSAIYKFDVDTEFFHDEKENFSWAYRQINNTQVFSFHHPPPLLAKKYRITENGGYSWRDVDEIKWQDNGESKKIYAPNLASELIRKSLIALCHQKGLGYCSETDLHYFPDKLLDRNRLPITLPDGKKITPLSAVGEKKFFKPNDQSEYYRYYIAPTFTVRRDLLEGIVALFRLKIRFTDLSGKVLDKRKIVSRRKHLCGSWFNDEWFKRNLAVAQFLGRDGQIVVGDVPKEEVVLPAIPIAFTASGGINEAALEVTSFERESIFLMQSSDEDELSEEQSNENE